MHARRSGSRFAVPGLAAALLALGACSNKPAAPPTAVSICDLAQYTGRSVSTEALLASSGDRTLMRGTACPNADVELRLTDAAFKSGQIRKLQAVVRAAPVGSNISVQLTGVYSQGADGAVFTVESVGQASYPKVD
ncbi:MAG: hypothetical protein QM718_12520 [Steroidobacteraceae bacterium]